MNNQDSLDVVLEIDFKEMSQELRDAEMNLWTPHFAALLAHMMLEDDQD